MTYDWAEAFVALNVCLKPAVDQLFMVELGAVARVRGDFVLGQILASLEEDCAWQRRWTAALVGVALDARPENRAACSEWVRAWGAEVSGAVGALAALVDDTDAAQLAARVEGRLTDFHRALEIEAGGGSP